MFFVCVPPLTACIYMYIVRYESKEVADKVLSEKHTLKGLSMGVKIAIRKETRLFLGGIKSDVTEESLVTKTQRTTKCLKKNFLNFKSAKRDISFTEKNIFLYDVLRIH